MKHFETATVKLTMLYVALLMGLSLILSVWLYHAASRELHIAWSAEISTGVVAIDDHPGRASSQRLLRDLVYFNLIVFGGGTLLSHLLARRTLRPIQQSYQQQEEFASNASHQLRTPLTVLKGELQVVLRDKKATAATYRAAVTSGLEEVDRLIALSTRLLRLSAGRSPHSEKSDAKIAIQKTLVHLQPLIGKKDLDIRPHFAHLTIPMAEADLVEVLSVIVDNAIKYSPSGGTIELYVKEENRKAGISIIDKGPGITSRDMPHIFERFYRGRQAAGEGYGLGLAFAQKLVAEAGGTIDVESRPGRTRFTIYFPV